MNDGAPRQAAAASDWLAQAFTCFNKGQLDAAQILCDRIVQAEPGLAEAYNLSAAIALQQGRPQDAANLLGQAITGNGAIWEYHHNRGDILIALGRHDEAVACFQAVLRLQPQALDSLFQLGLAQLGAGHAEAASACFKALVVAVPQLPEAYHRLGTIALTAGARDAASRLFGIAVTCQPDFADSHTNLAILRQEDGAFAAALMGFRLTVALRPDDAYTYCNLGTLLKELDQRDDLSPVLQRSVTLMPDNAEFHYSLAMSRNFSESDPRLVGLQRLADKAGQLDPPSQINLHFALAKAYEDVGARDRSFDHQIAGNQLKRAEIDYDPAIAAAKLGRIEAAFGAERERRSGGDPSDLPIFVVGMPRSGSSLIEQILASHSRVFGAGELPDFPLLAYELGAQDGPQFPEIVAEMDDGAFARLGARYVAALKAKAPQAERIVDKMPDNFRLIGLIHQALPKARIIHSRRDAVDTCLSIFSKLFTDRLPFAYDLAEIGRYWRAYDQLMAHWRTILPAGSFLDVDYEALVADQEGQTRRMLDYCGLEWEPACLQFHRTERVVRTASKLQVRRPLYSTSVGRWRPAPELLAPLLTGLAGG
jgi:tetratricopeptide (TPR) repeat protein